MPIVTMYYKSLFGKKRQVSERFIVDENGQKNGLYQSYHKNGQPAITCTYKDGQKNGTCIMRYENGRISSECVYQDGQREGVYRSYYHDGTKHQEYTFKKGVYNGECRDFEPDGRLASIYTYRDGKKDGVCEVRYGDEIERQIYAADVLVQAEQISAQLNIKMVQCYEAGTLQEQRNYSYNAYHQLERMVTFSPNDQQEHVTTYYENGTTREVYSCAHGQRVGSYTRFSETGLPMEESYYENGRLVGMRRVYYPNETGTIREEARYVAGRMDGICVRYDDQAKVVERCQYRNGKKVIYPEMVEALFVKQADREKRDEVADKLLAMRQQGQSTNAVVFAKQFHEQSDISRRTALKRDQQKCRS